MRPIALDAVASGSSRIFVARKVPQAVLTAVARRLMLTIGINQRPDPRGRGSSITGAAAVREPRGILAAMPDAAAHLVPINEIEAARERLGNVSIGHRSCPQRRPPRG